MNEQAKQNEIDTTGCRLEIMDWHDRGGFCMVQESISPEEWNQIVSDCELGVLLDMTYRLVNDDGLVVAECRYRKQPKKTF